MNPIKEAFQRAKQDIEELRFQLSTIQEQLEELKRTLQQTSTPTHFLQSPTNQHTTPTDIPTYSNTPTGNLPLKAIKTQISEFSTGNEGVPTDRQTDQQTDQHIIHVPKTVSETPISSPKRISEALDSLSEIKQSLRRQFSSLTPQEMLVFSTIYQLEEEGSQVDYPLLATRLKLTESSIRDYVLKLLRKGTPLQKTKENNKKVRLTIQQELRKIASLQAILALREL